MAGLTGLGYVLNHNGNTEGDTTMKAFEVFDCTTDSFGIYPDGTKAKDHKVFGPEWFARMVAVVMSKMTGRFHDYEPWGHR